MSYQGRIGGRQRRLRLFLDSAKPTAEFKVSRYGRERETKASRRVLKKRNSLRPGILLGVHLYPVILLLRTHLPSSSSNQCHIRSTAVRRVRIIRARRYAGKELIKVGKGPRGSSMNEYRVRSPIHENIKHNRCISRAKKIYNTSFRWRSRFVRGSIDVGNKYR